MSEIIYVYSGKAVVDRPGQQSIVVHGSARETPVTAMRRSYPETASHRVINLDHRWRSPYGPVVW